MKTIELARQVAELRKIQKAYFKEKNYVLLERAKFLEKELDDSLCTQLFEEDFNFIFLITKMRLAQQRFFSSLFFERMTWLERAKMAEVSVDIELKNNYPGALETFGGDYEV